MSDGEHVLVPQRTEGGDHDLVAVAVADGSEVWRTRLPAALQSIYASPDGHVVASRSAGLIGLG